jgi:peptide/nickel transport system substrate-binding protein
MYPNWLEGTVYQTLVQANLSAEQKLGQLQFLPELATGWTASADNMTYTFTLRNGVTFSDANPFNAYAVWAQFYMDDYYIQGNSSTPFYGLALWDFSAVNFGPSTMNLINQSGLSNPSSQLLSIMSNTKWPVYVTGPNTIVFHMNTPFPFFLSLLSGYAMNIFDPTFVLKNGGPGSAVSINGYFNQHAVPGTGPYVVTDVSENSYVKFQQRPGYWGNNLSAAQIAANPRTSSSTARQMKHPGTSTSLRVLFRLRH